MAVLLVLSRLDYCNSWFWSMPKNQLLRLQRVQNTAARISRKQRGQITSLPSSVSYSGYLLKCDIDYKILSLEYSCMNGTAPQYLQELIPATFQSAICGPPPNLVFASSVSTKKSVSWCCEPSQPPGVTSRKQQQKTFESENFLALYRKL